MFLGLVAQAECVIIFTSFRNMGLVLECLNVVHLWCQKKTKSKNNSNKKNKQKPNQTKNKQTIIIKISQGKLFLPMEL